MKILHLADLHIGLKLHGRDLSEDQRYVLDQAVRLAAEKAPDAVVIAGDIYDRALPSSESVQLFDRFITGLTQALPDAAILLIAGNHDGGRRIDCYRNILEKQSVYVAGLPPVTEEEHLGCVTLRDEYGEVRVYLLPFVRPSMVRQLVAQPEEELTYSEAVRRVLARESVDPSVRNVLVSHQFYVPSGSGADAVERSDAEILTVGNIDEVDSAVLEPFDYAALGHIHRRMCAGAERFMYSGTPMAVSVSESTQEKGMVLVTLGKKGELAKEFIPLHPLHRVRILEGSAEEILAQPSEDYVAVRLTERPGEADADLGERLRAAFPRLLEIRFTGAVRRPGALGAEESEDGAGGGLPEPWELLCHFLGDMDEEEAAIARDVLNTVRERSES